VDGFNLFYRALKGTKYKWLDLWQMVRLVLQPHHRIEKIKYYTALVLPENRNTDKRDRQEKYIEALKRHIPEIEVIEGRFKQTRMSMRQANPSAEPKFVEVLKREEKASDVNLAVHMVRDGLNGSYECAVVVSNDADLREALRIVKEETDKRVGVISPQEPIVEDLKRNAHFFRYIRSTTLKKAQLPDPIPVTPPVYKPTDWV
jgi:uncharacterized LabA/DUF88 family protein